MRDFSMKDKIGYTLGIWVAAVQNNLELCF